VAALAPSHSAAHHTPHGLQLYQAGQRPPRRAAVAVRGGRQAGQLPHCPSGAGGGVRIRGPKHGAAGEKIPQDSALSCILVGTRFGARSKPHGDCSQARGARRWRSGRERRRGDGGCGWTKRWGGGVGWATPVSDCAAPTGELRGGGGAGGSGGQGGCWWKRWGGSFGRAPELRVDVDATAPGELLGERRVCPRDTRAAGPHGRALIARRAEWWLAVVLANKLPRVGQRGAVQLGLTDVVRSVDILARPRGTGARGTRGRVRSGRTCRWLPWAHEARLPVDSEGKFIALEMGT